MATLQNLVIDQGTTFERIFELSDEDGAIYDLSLYSVIAQMRRSYTSNDGLQFSTAKIGDPTSGTLSISLTADETSTLKVGRYVYDIYLVYGGDKIRAVEGIITVTPTTTK